MTDGSVPKGTTGEIRKRSPSLMLFQGTLLYARFCVGRAPAIMRMLILFKRTMTSRWLAWSSAMALLCLSAVQCSPVPPEGASNPSEIYPRAGLKSVSHDSIYELEMKRERAPGRLAKNRSPVNLTAMRIARALRAASYEEKVPTRGYWCTIRTSQRRIA